MLEHDTHRGEKRRQNSDV